MLSTSGKQIRITSFVFSPIAICLMLQWMFQEICWLKIDLAFFPKKKKEGLAEELTILYDVKAKLYVIKET